MSKGLSQPQLRALRWLRANGRTARLDSVGRARTAGNTASHIATQTWLRLFISGHLVKALNHEGWFELTSKGAQRSPAGAR